MCRPLRVRTTWCQVRGLIADFPARTFSPVEHQAFREQRVIDPGRAVLEKAPVDQDREGPGRHVDRLSPGAESRPVGSTSLAGRDPLTKQSGLACQDYERQDEDS